MTFVFVPKRSFVCFEYFCFILSCYNIMFKSNYCLVGFFFPSPPILNLPSRMGEDTDCGSSTVWCAGAEPCHVASQKRARGEKSCSDLAVPVPRPQHTQGRDGALAEKNVNLASQAFMNSARIKQPRQHTGLFRSFLFCVKMVIIYLSTYNAIIVKRQ